MRCKLKYMIRLRGIQQKKLAEAVGIGSTYLSAIVNGRKNPSDYVAFRLAEELDMPIADVLCVEKVG